MNTLWTSLRSPFGRRVRIALQERGIDYREQIIEVFAPPPEFLAIAPLGRVPVWVNAKGLAVPDSNAILTGLLCTQPLHALESSDEVLSWMGLAVGMMEKTVAQFLAWSAARSAGRAPDGDVIEEFRLVKEAFCNQVENAAAQVLQVSGTFLVGGGLTQADIDVCTALTYLTLRDSPEWQERYPNTRRYADALESRPAFVLTRPPR